MLLVPLDATDAVPLDDAFIKSFRAVIEAGRRKPSPLATLASRVLDRAAGCGAAYAWDVLAAASIANDAVLRNVRDHGVCVNVTGDNAGATSRAAHDAAGTTVSVAYGADAESFKELFVRVVTDGCSM